MENKYYTPEIEEFHIGFEFEFETGAEGWKKFIFDKDRPENILSNVKDFPTQFRVKYLDKEDIEFLGFKLKGKAIDLWFEKEEIYLRDDGHHLNNIKLQYGLHDNRLKLTFIYTSGEEQIHFEGKIKNISELKVLLKQLNIL